MSGRGKLGIDMREIWTMQPRFEKRVGNAPFSLLDQPRFRAGFDFMRLRGQIGEITPRGSNLCCDFGSSWSCRAAMASSEVFAISVEFYFERSPAIDVLVELGDGCFRILNAVELNHAGAFGASPFEEDLCLLNG